ncbi:hypothetical protein H2198_000735 [Neophaeococcomyces mojaviensis]|uniref:Uncharacterized protein n=1 Tax=Neophaeococcomyces mojaviensis TaxID=3383035 RepID=A0ACC3AJI5_9EURO|nr:hypothetical protein H2198_000735 [Knufia sp. JES_112]
MLRQPISLLLDDDSHAEDPVSRDLRLKASTTIKNLDQTSDAELVKTLPDALLELIAQVVKPLFSRDQHEKLTTTGRKNFVSNSLPTAVNRFDNQVLFDDNQPMWKNGWTSSLLVYVLKSYARLEDTMQRKKTVEAHFHLLVPPILHLIDDIDIIYKASGCHCLKLLCDNLSSVQSEVLKRSGLTDVFIEALKNDFSHLPTLTPEEDSIALFQELYPAFRSLVQARFVGSAGSSKAGIRTSSTTNARQNGNSDEDMRQSYLTLLLRHQLLHSLSHLSTGSGAGSTMSVSLSTFFLSQLGWIFADMGLPSVVHLQSVLPVLRNVMSDPFSTSAPEMLLEATRAEKVIIQTCWPRIRDKWWGECLRGLIACWTNITDDEADIKDKRQSQSLSDVKHELKVLVCLLEDVVGQPFVEAKDDLIKEENTLQTLFDGKIE